MRKRRRVPPFPLLSPSFFPYCVPRSRYPPYCCPPPPPPPGASRGPLGLHLGLSGETRRAPGGTPGAQGNSCRFACPHQLIQRRCPGELLGPGKSKLSVRGESFGPLKVPSEVSRSVPSVLGRKKSMILAFAGLPGCPLGGLLGHLGSILGASWAVLGHLEAILGRLGCILGRLGGILGPS